MSKRRKRPPVGLEPDEAERAEKSVIVSEGEEVDRVLAQHNTVIDDFPASMGKAAFYGLPGQIVEILEHHCEACR